MAKLGVNPAYSDALRLFVIGTALACILAACLAGIAGKAWRSRAHREPALGTEAVGP